MESPISFNGKIRSPDTKNRERYYDKDRTLQKLKNVKLEFKIQLYQMHEELNRMKQIEEVSMDYRNKVDSLIQLGILY